MHRIPSCLSGLQETSPKSTAGRVNVLASRFASCQMQYSDASVLLPCCVLSLPSYQVRKPCGSARVLCPPPFFMRV